jgi:UDP-GlcNAc3NAcA epimerase
MMTADRKPTRTMVNWLSIVGARPQFIKLGPVCKAIEGHNRKGGLPHIVHRIVHTGQHYDREVAGIIFEQAKLPEPNYNLGVGSETYGAQMARMFERLEKVLVSENPNWTILYGDTNSTLGGALVASRLNLPIVHVEAGCRSSNLGMPEEQNRVVADHLSQLLLAASHSAIENLRREGIATGCDPRRRKAVFVGDVMYDALLQNLPQAEARAPHLLQKLQLQRGEYYVLTLHRAENTDDPARLQQVLDAVAKLDLPVIFPVHPRTRRIFASSEITVWGCVRSMAALGYLDMLALEKNARGVLTDSGGVQKEAFYFQVPCVTLRQVTEWPETVELGANRISEATTESLHSALNDNHRGDWLSAKPYGDGDAASKIVEEILSAPCG